LKGENLLITSNDRVKVTDFGFARIASRNAEEMRRMTYCGTDVSLSQLHADGFELIARASGIHESRDHQRS
jgi:LIM domain kinase 1